MNYLETIIAHKKEEVAARKNFQPFRQLEVQPLFTRATYSLTSSVLHPASSGIIAEFKRRSPSKGIINAGAQVATVVEGYLRAGAAALSVLTDEKFFGGSNADLSTARACSCPILRKDFVVDEYQIVEARSIGADAILLIAAVLSPAEARTLTALAHSLHLEVLLEIHDEQEWTRFAEVGADVVGVNNRNLKTFEVSLSVSRQLAEILPRELVKVSESGLDRVAAIHELRACGYQGFLMGEIFMRQRHPENAARDFIQELRRR